MTTATAVAVEPLAITAAGVVTPAGLGLDALGAALAGAPVAGGDPADVTAETLPPRPVRVAPELPVAELLGKKGNRQLDRTTKLALIATRLALDVAAAGTPESGPVTTARSGVVLGTSTGSIRSSSEYSRETLELEKPYLVNPGLFPNTVMNCAAGQVAIRHGLHGVNATLAGGHLSGLQAVKYARNALRQGHADRLLVGGVEEFCAQSAWGWHRSGALAPGAAVGEAAALLLLEPADAARESGRRTLAQALACEVGFGGTDVASGGLSAALARVVGAALERSGVTPAEVGALSLGASGQSGLERIEERAVARVLGALPERVLRAKRVLGESFSAGGAVQIAAVLAVWEREQAPAGSVALVTSLSPDGQVGCLVLRR
ncbi:beta-ketoacyl synthase N-terminal-like domain-containing protein [Kitasatospora sp. NPDC004614]|uniref:beta-ketoacyl synthase N-terminal-like domain-containing protein n=1 Tax=unclassified Kitasatospora TaxID=2633591 RepID=UPI00368A37AE